MNKYIFTVTHDNGTCKITIPARDIASAIIQLKDSECCPENAITNIKIVYQNGKK